MGAFGASARAKRSTAASLCGGGTVEGSWRPRAAAGRGRALPRRVAARSWGPDPLSEACWSESAVRCQEWGTGHRDRCTENAAKKGNRESSIFWGNRESLSVAGQSVPAGGPAYWNFSHTWNYYYLLQFWVSRHIRVEGASQVWLTVTGLQHTRHCEPTCWGAVLALAGRARHALATVP